MIIAYNAVCALVGYLLLTKPLSDVLPWFSEAPKFALAGWNFWDYVKLSLLLQGTISLCIELLFYDRTSKKDSPARAFFKSITASNHNLTLWNHYAMDFSRKLLSTW